MQDKGWHGHRLAYTRRTPCKTKVGMVTARSTSECVDMYSVSVLLKNKSIYLSAGEKGTKGPISLAWRLAGDLVATRVSAGYLLLACCSNPNRSSLEAIPGCQSCHVPKKVPRLCSLIYIHVQ